MATVKFDSNNFDNLIIPSALSGRNYIQQAADCINNCVVPSDFEYANLLNETASKLSEMISKIDKFNDWYNKTRNFYNDNNSNNFEDIRKIDIVNIKGRINPLIG